MKKTDYSYIVIEEHGKKSFVSLECTSKFSEALQFDNPEIATEFAQKHLPNKNFSVVDVIEAIK